LNKVIELGINQTKINPSDSNKYQYNIIEKSRERPEGAHIRNHQHPTLVTFFTETIQRMERNIQLLSIQNKLIKEQNIKLLQNNGYPVKDKIEYKINETTGDLRESIKCSSTAHKYENAYDTIKIIPTHIKIIEYLNSKHKDALNISTFYNEERGVLFTTPDMNIERILTVDIITLVYEWFSIKIEGIDKYKIPLQVHKKTTYIKIDDEWRVDNDKKEESFLETFLLPFYELLIKTNEDMNRSESEKTIIERMMTKYMCMNKETKDKILKKILKHPKILCDIKL